MHVPSEQKQNQNRYSCHNILGLLWIVGLALTLIFYHLWWVNGKNVVHSQCLVESQRIKTTKCEQPEADRRNLGHSQHCYYAQWHVRYNTAKHEKTSHIDGEHTLDPQTAQETVLTYSVGETYRCYYSATKSGDVQWNDPGSYYMYLFSVGLFMCSILPCVCWLIGIPKLYNWCYQRLRFKSSFAEPVLLDEHNAGNHNNNNHLSRPPPHNPNYRQEGQPPIEGEPGAQSQSWVSSLFSQGTTCRACNQKLGNSNFQYCPYCGCSTNPQERAVPHLISTANKAPRQA